MRLKRLQVDFDCISRLVDTSPYISMTHQGSPPHTYIITYSIKGLIKLPGNPQPSISAHHQVRIYLHNDYPRLPPRLTWLTDIFHPNILPPRRNGGVCLGGWSPAFTLDQLVLNIGEMIQYKNYCTSDWLNDNAAVWTRQNKTTLPVDNTPLESEKTMQKTG